MRLRPATVVSCTVSFLQAVCCADASLGQDATAPIARDFQQAGPVSRGDGFWAFQPVGNPVLPPVEDTNWPKSGLDHFILAGLESQGLSPADRADKRALIRRATFDLTGLPPTPAEVRDFLADSSPEAFAKVVDRLLASPRYGERWGRHWLDVARYADSNGLDENMAYANAYRYRDYVIAAFNDDKPFDQFVHEQLAGDLLPPSGDARRDAARIIATGFLVLGPKSLREVDGAKMEMDIIDEQVSTLGNAFLGLTLGCARCHDHKFDPLTMHDYYALAGIFQSTRSMERHVDERGLGNGMWLEREVATDPPGHAMAVTDGKVQNAAVRLRGDALAPGEVVPRGFPHILRGNHHNPVDSNRSGRLELARWLTDAQHPLTSRVMVNRIWQWHFGKPLVATPDNFGRLGERPTHPELLDWLAKRFVDGGWSVKGIHRLIMLSATYQMSSAYDTQSADIDAQNRWYWRFDRRRLEAEEIRDALLFASGTLDLTMGGSMLGLNKGQYVNDAQSSQHLVKYQTTRRSVYLPVIRNVVYDVFATFDFPDPGVVNGARQTTTVAPQALLLLNSPLVLEQSRHFAKRLLARVDLDDAGRLQLAYEIAYGRRPTEDESGGGQEYLQRYQQAFGAQEGRERTDIVLEAWSSLCQVLICSNEFLYVE